jgi:AraC-like DNA-binding protein
VYNPSHDIEVLWLAETEYNAGASLKEHSHEEYFQIYYVIDSTGIFLINGEEHLLGKDMFVFAKPDTIHGIKELPSDIQTPLRILEVKFIVLNQEFGNELKQIPSVLNGTDAMAAILRQNFVEGMKKGLYYPRIVEHQMCTLLCYILRQSKEQNMLLNIDNPSNETATKIKNYLELNYSEDVKLDDLAVKIGFSKNYLCRVFRESTGITINLCLNNIRIDKAVELLAGTDMDIAEISKVVGYNNVYHFIKTFKKVVGVSPGNYRSNELTGKKLATESVYAKSVIIRAGIVIPK